jgi:uncharacterized protein
MALALVTGATGGIGAAFADRLAAEGHDLVLVARGAERLMTTAADLQARHGVAVETLAADLADRDGLAAVENRLADPGARPVDILVNNAGVHVDGEFLTADLARLQEEVDVNVSAVLRLTHRALPGMVGRGHGSVILVSSFSGYLPPAGSAYGASKAWSIAFADTLAASLHGTGVQVTALCPGYVRTGMVQGIREDAGFRQGFLIMDADAVVRRCLADHRRGHVVSTPGLVYGLVRGWLELPRRTLRLAARLAGRAREQRATRHAAAVARAAR